MTRPLRRILCGLLSVGLLCAVCACGDDTMRTTESTEVITTTTADASLLSDRVPYVGDQVAPLFTDTLLDVSWSGEPSFTVRPTTEQDPEELNYFAYAIVSPYTNPMEDTVVSMLSSLSALYAEAVIARPTAEQLAQAGLDQPMAEMNFRYTDDTAHHIAVGNTVGATIAVQIDGGDAIYFVDDETYGELFSLTYDQAVNPYLVFIHIKTLQTVSLRSVDLACDFQLQHYPDDTNPDTNLTVMLGDAVYPTADFRTLYEIMMSVTRVGVGGIVPDTDPLLEMTLGGADGAVVRQVRFYENTNETAIGVFESGETITVRMTDLTYLQLQIERYLAGQPVIVK